MSKDLQKLYAPYRKWRKENLRHENGIIIGSDLTQEWMLPWWWDHYQRFNSLPVAFADFGMSEESKKWCQERGELIHLQVADIFVATKEEMDFSLVKKMEDACGNLFWPSRNAWFKKPLACLHSPFLNSLWVDLDCEIRGSLNPLFSFTNKSVAMAQETFDCCTERIDYNAGIIVFKHGNPIFEMWADQSFESNYRFRGDQDLLNTIIQEQKFKVDELPQIYNWSRLKGDHPDAVVLHWHGPQGKSEIAHQIMRKNLSFFAG